MLFMIRFSFVYIGVYLTSMLISGGEPLTFLLFACSPLVVISLVVSILKDGKQSQKTFEEFFYQDEDIRRV